MKKNNQMSPMMQQYLELKEQYKDCIIFYRLGDFYEMFDEDAKIASKELEITLTGRDCGLEERMPMCGVPFHAYESYAQKLIEKGYKVAICEQTDKMINKVMQREIVRIITPGTVIDSSMLDETKNSFIMCLYKNKNTFLQKGLPTTNAGINHIICRKEFEKQESKGSTHFLIIAVF